MHNTVVVFNIPEEFTVEAVIGQGAYGAVCKANWDGEEVAIKKIPAYSKSADQAKKVLREVEILKHFQYCPQVIASHAMFRPQNGEKDLYIVMEYLPTDLSTAMKNKVPMDEDIIRYIVCQLLLALRAMHYYGCIHRDLSCRNILIDGSSRVSVCDFGLSRFYDPEELLSFGVVTQWYRAPEIITDAKYDARSDVFSVGVILGELLLQRHLFPGKANDPADQLNRIFTVLGTPDPNLFHTEGEPFFTSSANAKRYVDMYVTKRPLQPRLRDLKFAIEHQPSAVDTLEALLSFNPQTRPSADEALQMPWFEPLRQYINDEIKEQDASHASIKFSPTSIPADSPLNEIVEMIEGVVPIYTKDITTRWKEQRPKGEE